MSEPRPAAPKAVPKAAPKASPKGVTTTTNQRIPVTTAEPVQPIAVQQTPLYDPNQVSEVNTAISRTGIADNPAILTKELFGQNRVVLLEAEDFKLDTEHQIDIKHKSCYLILFHTNNIESENLAIIWNAVAQQVPGPTFAAVNLMQERKIAQAFNDLSTNNSSYRTFELKGVPFILSYQNTTPVAFYNGERSVQALSDYALTKACRADNFEPLQLTAGIQTDNNIAMTGWAEYDNSKRSSVDYKTDSNIRKYDPTQKPVIVGSQAYATEGRQVAEQEAAEGVTQTVGGASTQTLQGANVEEAESARIAGLQAAPATVLEAPTNNSIFGEQVVSPK